VFAMPVFVMLVACMARWSLQEETMHNGFHRLAQVLGRYRQPFV